MSRKYITISPLDKDYPDELYGSIPEEKKLRRAKLEVFYSLLLKYEEFKEMEDDKSYQICRHIERGCYDRTRMIAKEECVECKFSCAEFTKIYELTCFDISSSIDKNNSAYSPIAIKMIFDGDALKLGAMTPYDMRPDMKVEADEIIARSLNVTTFVPKTSTHYTCGRCKINKTQTYALKNRSNDEGTSFKVVCVNCGNRWSEGH